MSVRTVLWSALLVVAAIAGAGSSTLQAEPSTPLKMSPMHDSMLGAAAPPAEFATSDSADVKDRVASATRPLDLHKLSMSDFGDVEQPR